MDRSNFDPYRQNITFLAADGITEISVPIPLIDQWNDESVSICMNYGAQVGACIIMLAVVLIMTPVSKLSRPSNLLHILGLVVCLIRMILLCLYFLSPFGHFYQTWGEDWSQVPLHDYQISIAGTTFSLLLVIVVEVALMNQAWTMVSLWPGLAKYSVSAASAIITLLTIGFRLTFTVIQSKSILSDVPPREFDWLVRATPVTNALSICWFCAVFNVKLVTHLISNRGLLPSRRAMNPMEVLVITNGILMIVPVIFTGLEFGKFTNFEAGSLAPTSVAIILPLGTLAAQRSAQSGHMSYLSASSSSGGASGGIFNRRFKSPHGSSSARLKDSSSPFSSSSSTPQVSYLSRCEEGAVIRERIDPVDLELRHIDGYQEPKVARTKAESSMEQCHQ